MRVTATKIGLFPLLLVLFFSCEKKSSTTSTAVSNQSASHAALATDVASGPRAVVRDRVNPADLDSSLFYPLGLVVGLETYIDAKSPILSYTIPKQADYMEIIRCDNKTVIETGVESISIQNLSTSSLPQSKKDALYRGNDYFNLALINKDCTQLSLATTDATFSDTFAHSGNWFYLVHACVNPNRMMNVGQSSNRSCSRQVAISAPLLDYKNLRDDKINNALQKENVATSTIMSISQKICEAADQYAAALDTCATTEQDREEAKKKRDALAQLIGSGIEFGIAVLTMGSGVFNNILHFMFLSGGFTFGVLLKNIMSSAADMPRTCTDADIDGMNRISSLMTSLAYQKDLQIFWQTQVDNAKNGNQVLASPSFQVPDYNQQLNNVLQQRQLISK